MAENPEKEDEYLDKFVDLQMSIHTKRASGLLKIKEKMMNKDTCMYERLVEKTKQDYLGKE